MIPYLIIFGLLLLVLAWLLLGGRDDAHEPTTQRRASDAVDRIALEQAERDVQDATDEDAVRDWGPGTTRPRPPELL